MPAPPAILIVEDDPGVRRILDVALRKAGWPTLVAGGGSEGIEAALKYDGPIPLAIVDLVMPHVGGLDMANQLLVDRPATKVLYISGVNSVAMDSIRRRTPELMLQKPFSVKELLETIRKILGE
jgi:two-component system, cell cycle sensor histidine kinase and response regulator CckA